jgi:hypothetical protein
MTIKEEVQEIYDNITRCNSLIEKYKAQVVHGGKSPALQRDYCNKVYDLQQELKKEKELLLNLIKGGNAMAVIDNLRKQIQDVATLKLLKEKELSDLTGVSKTTCQEAISELENKIITLEGQIASVNASLGK